MFSLTNVCSLCGKKPFAESISVIFNYGSLVSDVSIYFVLLELVRISLCSQTVTEAYKPRGFDKSFCFVPGGLRFCD